MLSSLPPIAPHDPHILYSSLSSHHHHHHHHHAHSPFDPAHPPHNHQARQNQQHTHHHHAPSRSLLTSLRIDENIVLNRKANIRRFGAGWLRPPGVPKTLQGMWDEKCEREEQELVNAREQAATDALTAAEEAAEALALPTASPLPERDLDSEIPDAAEEWIDDEASSNAADLTFEGEGDYADNELQNNAGEGINLDDDVPEAGSYQHTDTDVEDSSSFEDGVEGDEDVGGVFGMEGGRMGMGRARGGVEGMGMGSPVERGNVGRGIGRGRMSLD